MLSLRSINQFYGQNHILWDVDLDLAPGTCTGVLGRPGMGKTTLVNCIMGHLPINSGSMTWQEANRRRRICCCSRWSNGRPGHWLCAAGATAFLPA